MGSAFVGRQREIARLEELSEAPLVTLWGTGGVGKTRLAVELAARERARGVTMPWADLAGARSRSETLTVLAAALGVVLSSHGDEVETIGRAARAQRARVVVDNVEQLDAGARAMLGQLVSAGARLLVTSRELLGLTGEVDVAVAPLGEDDGVALFEALAGRAAVGGVEGAASITRAIVRRLDALPLAIELAAARVPVLGAAELLARLDRKLDVLATSRADRPARHATLRAAIAWSWELLDDAEREALKACATFEAPFDAALADAVIAGDEVEALDRLERLRGRALVHATNDARGRVTLHLLESVRDFVREQSEERGPHDAEHVARGERHAAAVVARCEPLAESSRCGRDALDELETRRPDLLRVVRRPGPWAARAALVLATSYATSGPASAAVLLLEAAEEGLDEREERLLLARVRVAKGDALRATGKLAEAKVALLHASEVAIALGTSPEALVVGAEASRVLGSVLRATGEVEEALLRKDAALATYRAVGDRAREGICLGEIGAVHQSQGRLARAKTFHAAAIAIHVAVRSRRAEGVERSYLAVATHRSGDPSSSIALHEQALAIHREVEHRRLEGAELLHLGFVHHELGATTSAREALREARRLLAVSGARGLESMALIFAARLEVDTGDPTAALLLLAEAAEVAPATWPRVTATRHLVEGHLAMTTGAPERARDSYEAALSSSRDLEVGFEALTPAYLALAGARAGSYDHARIEALLEDARAATASLENPQLRVALAVLSAAARSVAPPEVEGAASSRSSEVRRALAWSGARRVLVIDDDGKRVSLPDGRVVDLSRRKNVRMILLALARARRETPGVKVLPDTLLEAGWAGERMRPEAATKRLHTAIWTLRSAGLEALLLTEGDGYMLDPRVDLHLHEL